MNKDLIRKLENTISDIENEIKNLDSGDIEKAEALRFSKECFEVALEAVINGRK